MQPSDELRLGVRPLPDDAVEHGLPVEPDLPAVTLWEDHDEPGLAMVLRPIPAGEYWVGSRGASNRQEEPCHRVVLPVPRGRDDRELDGLPSFWMADAPVTVAQFERWKSTDAYHAFCQQNLKANGLEFEPVSDTPGSSDLPAKSVSWYEAVGYCAWLNQDAFPEQARLHRTRAGVDWTGAFMLPGEEAWEVACRAGTSSENCSGSDDAALREVGWSRMNAEGVRPVRALRPNHWGLYDVHGNVWEWCSDAWAWDASSYRWKVGGDAVRFEPSHDVAGASSSSRVVRGGSWVDPAWLCRSATRSRGRPGYRGRYGSQGFRVCLLPGPGGSAPGRGASGRARAEAEGGAAGEGGTPERRAPDDAGAVAGESWDDLRLPSVPARDRVASSGR